MRRMDNETTELQLREPPPWLRLHLAWGATSARRNHGFNGALHHTLLLTCSGWDATLGSGNMKRTSPENVARAAGNSKMPSAGWVPGPGRAASGSAASIDRDPVAVGRSGDKRALASRPWRSARGGTPGCPSRPRAESARTAYCTVATGRLPRWFGRVFCCSLSPECRGGALLVAPLFTIFDPGRR